MLRTHRIPNVLGPQTFTAPRAAWVPQEWLFSLFVALARDFRVFPLFAIAISALPLWILISIYLRSRGTARPEAIGIACFFCGIALLESFGIRAQVLGWAALAAFLYFLERDDGWYYAAFPVAVIWANVHASVALAPLIVGARLAAAGLGGASPLCKSRDLFMLPLALLAMFLTPLGWRIPELALTLAASPIRHYITEWQPPTLRDVSFALGALPLALAAVMGGGQRLWQDRLRSFPAALLFAAALFASRNVPLFAIAAAPLAASGLSWRFRFLERLEAKLRELEGFALVSICVAIGLSALALFRTQQHSPPRLPLESIAFLAGDEQRHRLFCEDFSWCSVALGYPRLSVFIDGRCDGYPIGIWRQYITAIHAPSSWERPLQDHNVDSVIAFRGSRLDERLTTSVSWKLAERDSAYELFRRE
ncbi:MAG TPA: hypothetical protein VGG51_11305 [Candidatus Cybelea sp.]|jgi:hypothetical protein